MRLLLGRGDVIAPCKSSDDEDGTASAARPAVAADLSPATTPRQRKLQHLHLPAVQVGVKKKDEAPAAAAASSAAASAAAVAAAKRKDALQVVKARFMRPKGSSSSSAAGGGHGGVRDAAGSPAQPASPTTPRGETPSTPKSAATLARLYNSNKSSSTTTSKAHTPRAAAAAAVKKKAQQPQVPAAATSPTHGATRQPSASVSPRNSPGTPRGALALAPGLQSPERDGRGGAGSRAAGAAAAADRVHARLLAAAEECSSPRVVRRINLGGPKRGSSSRSGELNVGSSLHHQQQLQSSRGHTSSTRSGELGLPGQVGGIHLARSNNNRSGEIHGVGGRASSATTTSTGRLLVQGTGAANSPGPPGAAPRSPVKLLDRAAGARQPPATATAAPPAACAPPAPASHQDTSSSSRASGPGAARSAAAAAAEASTAARHQQHCQVPDSINLQDLEAGRVTDFDAAGYDLAPGPPLPADAKHTQFWLLNPAPADGDDSRRRSSSFSTTSSSARTSSASSSSASFDPFCIPTGAPAPAPTPSKPHKASNDPNWEALRTTRSRDGALGLTHFRLLKRLGCGDIGSVYLAELRATTCYFAMKVMDKSRQQQQGQQQGRAGAAEDGARKKLDRAQTERRILEMLDHPFLPTLYAHFDTPHFTCLVMEFCPGGDLHSLRQAQPAKCFSISAARFYAAEVLLALEYLHMMGVVYRDLKPENVLVRTDGHIMLSDFDLSLKCDVNPTLLPTPSSCSSSSAAATSSSLHYSAPSSPSKRPSLSAAYSHHVRTLTACIMPVCRMPTSGAAAGLARKPSLPAAAAAAPSPSPSLPSSSASSPQQQPHHLTRGGSSRRTRRTSTSSLTSLVSSPSAAQAATHPPAVQLVAEPTDARSMSFVGTHEYLAPEVISGHGHGSAVDWWTLGVFLYELMYGRTPFRGPDNQATLRNVLTQRLRFPSPADDDLYSQSDDSDDDDDEQFASAAEGDGDARRRRSLRRQRRRSLSQAQQQQQRWSAEQQQQQLAAVSLIRGLLTKDPRRRLGSARGAAEIKAHPFFDGVNWALIRCATPPEVPKAFRPPQSVATVGGRTPPPSPAGDGDGGDRLAAADDDGFADVF